MSGSDIQHRWTAIRESLAHIGASHVRVVPVTKYQPAACLLSLLAIGVVDFAENYLQSLLLKIRYCEAHPMLHACVPRFIGRMDSMRKRLRLARVVDRIDSVSSVLDLQVLNRSRPIDAPSLSVCLQVNISGESQKQGFSVEDLPEALAVAASCTRLQVIGFMALVRPGTEREEKKDFTAMRDLFEYHQRSWPALQVLSMGTSDDFLWAAACGATEVRIGRHLWGEKTDG